MAVDPLTRAKKTSYTKIFLSILFSVDMTGLEPTRPPTFRRCILRSLIFLHRNFLLFYLGLPFFNFSAYRQCHAYVVCGYMPTGGWGSGVGVYMSCVEHRSASEDDT